jgi:anti-sigma regulatory factor (Ser/Thr protein kinase)
VFDTDRLEVQAVEHRLRLTVSAVPGVVRATASRARDSVADLLTTTRADDLESAVAEALANAVRHGTGPQGRAVCVKVDALDGWIVVRVRDAGHGQLANGPLDLWADAPQRALEAEHGRGLAIMRRLADEVEVADHADGRVVELRMRTASADDRGTEGNRSTP